MKLFLSFAIALTLRAHLFAAEVTERLSDAIKKNEVTMEAKDIDGKFMGEAVTMTITNNTKTSLELTMDPGMILKSLYPNMQQLVLVGSETITVRSRGKNELKVAVFCANAPRPSPIKDLPYVYQSMAGDSLVKVLKFIKENAVNDYLGQSAVWAVTNHNDLNNVYDNERATLSKQLIDLIAAATGREKPAYYAMNAQNWVPAGPAFIPQTEKIFVPFEADMKQEGMLTVKVFNTKNELVKTLMEHKKYPAGRQAFVTELNPDGMATGRYTVRLSNANEVIKDVQVQVYKFGGN